MSRQRILAVASAGGHWAQLQRLFPALEEHDLAFVTTDAGSREDAAPHRVHVVNDASRWNRLGLVRMALQVMGILPRERPDVVISTGAACGYFTIRLGKLMGSRMVRVDWVANVGELSMPGRLVRRWVERWSAQRPHLASREGPRFDGGTRSPFEWMVRVVDASAARPGRRDVSAEISPSELLITVPASITADLEPW